MSASNAINKTLFHGTAYTFGEGETINPSDGAHFYDRYLKDSTPRVYLTSDLDEAKLYASHRVDAQRMLFGPIYEVDAPDAVSVSDDIDKNSHLFGQSPDMYKKAYKDTYTSTSTTLTPKKIAGWAINSNIDNS